MNKPFADYLRLYGLSILWRWPFLLWAIYCGRRTRRKLERWAKQ